MAFSACSGYLTTTCKALIRAIRNRKSNLFLSSRKSTPAAFFQRQCQRKTKKKRRRKQERMRNGEKNANGKWGNRFRANFQKKKIKADAFTASSIHWRGGGGKVGMFSRYSFATYILNNTYFLVSFFSIIPFLVTYFGTFFFLPSCRAAWIKVIFTKISFEFSFKLFFFERSITSFKLPLRLGSNELISYQKEYTEKFILSYRTDNSSRLN